jgi:hypothetical protein
MSKLDAILSRLDGVKKTSSGYIARCPAHNDKGPSLSLKENERGNVILHCFAGCSHVDVVESIGLKESDLFAESRLTPNQIYYTNAQKEELEIQIWYVAIGLSDLKNRVRILPNDYQILWRCVRSLKREYRRLMKANEVEICRKIRVVLTQLNSKEEAA